MLVLFMLGALASIPAFGDSNVVGAVVAAKNARVGGVALMPGHTIFSGDDLRVEYGMTLVTMGKGSRMVFGRDTVASFAVRRNAGHFSENWCNDDQTGWAAPAPDAHAVHMRSTIGHQRERDPETGNEALSSIQFDDELDQMMDQLQKPRPGLLFVLRNDVPAALLGHKRLQRRGTALHHSDVPVRQYVGRLQRRHTILYERHGLVRVVLPRLLGEWFVRGQPILSPKVEPPSFRVASASLLREIWDEFCSIWAPKQVLRLFDPTRLGPLADPGHDGWANLRQRTRGLVINTLPDVWIRLSGTLDRPCSDQRLLTLVIMSHGSLAS